MKPRDHERRGWSDHEELYGMRMAIAMYPLIENAIRGDRKRSVPEHLQAMGRLFAQFAAVAAENPLATRRENYSAERLATIDAEPDVLEHGGLARIAKAAGEPLDADEGAFHWLIPDSSRAW